MSHSSAAHLQGKLQDVCIAAYQWNEASSILVHCGSEYVCLILLMIAIKAMLLSAIWCRRERGRAGAKQMTISRVAMIQH